MKENNDANDEFENEQKEVDAAFAEVMNLPGDEESSKNTDIKENTGKKQKHSGSRKQNHVTLAMKIVLIAFVLTGVIYFAVVSMGNKQTEYNVNPTAPDYSAVADYAAAKGLDISVVENVVFESTNSTDQAMAGSVIRYWVILTGLDGDGNLTQIKTEDVAAAESGTQNNTVPLRQNVIGLADTDANIAIAVSFCGLEQDFSYRIIRQNVSNDNLALLVNTRVGLPSDFGPASMYYGMEAEAGHALEQMIADASAAGYHLWIASDYRSYSQQEGLYNSAVASLGADQQDTAKPGFSEHQTGWATDITWSSAGGGLSVSMKNTPEYEWLMENSYKYGFVLRYPEGLTDVTGYYYEPWHFRYIGVDLATQYHESGMETLDEFLSIPR